MRPQGNSNLPGRVIYKSPQRLKEVWPDKQKWLNRDKPEDRDIVKAQVEKIREIYRLLRSELLDPERGHDRSVIVPGSFDADTTIQQHLLARFPAKYSSIIQFACYIEEHVNSFPEDPIRTWVTLPRQQVVNLIGNALNSGMDRYEVYTLLGTYLWARLGKTTEIDGIPGQLIQSYSITRLYDSIGVSVDKIKDIWGELGISNQHERTRPGRQYTVSSEVFIPDSHMIFEMAKITPSFKTPKMRSDTKLELSVPEDIIPKLNGYFFHYPVDAEGIINQRVPIIFSSDDTITIPLVSKICPAVIIALFTIPELAGLLNHLKANQRAKYIGSILKHTSECLELMNRSLLKFNRENQRINLTHLDNRNTFHQIITGMSVAGVTVDRDMLIKLDLETTTVKKSTKDTAEKERQKILSQITSTSGILHSQYQMKSRTERVYTNHYNIQGLPKVLHDVIIPDPGHRFIYFDIVSNDLTMLFNMIGDQQGLMMLKSSKDPYREIATEAFKDGHQRNRVKAFVSPFLYGAASKTIISKSRGLLDEHDIALLKRTMKELFPVSSSWLEQIRESANQGIIPKEFNPIDDGIDIPIPKVLGATVGPAMIIQRYGARLLRAIICALARNGYYPKVFVHDSLLIQVPEAENIDQAVYEVTEQIDLVRCSAGVKAMAIKIGNGESWKSANTEAMYKGLHD